MWRQTFVSIKLQYGFQLKSFRRRLDLSSKISSFLFSKLSPVFGLTISWALGVWFSLAPEALFLAHVDYPFPTEPHFSFSRALPGWSIGLELVSLVFSLASISLCSFCLGWKTACSGFIPYIPASMSIKCYSWFDFPFSPLNAIQPELFSIKLTVEKMVR